MGFVNDTVTSILIQLSAMTATVGTWTMTVTSHIWTWNKTAGADTSVLKVPLNFVGNGAKLKGGYLKSIDIWWINATADVTDMAVEIYQSTLPAQAGTLTTALQASTYDSAHDTAAKRKTQAQHQMTISLTTPIWVDQAAEVYMELTCTAAATSAVKLQGVRANYTLRL